MTVFLSAILAKSEILNEKPVVCLNKFCSSTLGDESTNEVGLFYHA